MKTKLIGLLISLLLFHLTVFSQTKQQDEQTGLSKELSSYEIIDEAQFMTILNQPNIRSLKLKLGSILNEEVYLERGQQKVQVTLVKENGEQQFTHTLSTYTVRNKDGYEIGRIGKVGDHIEGSFYPDKEYYELRPNNKFHRSINGSGRSKATSSILFRTTDKRISDNTSCTVADDGGSLNLSEAKTKQAGARTEVVKRCYAISGIPEADFTAYQSYGSNAILLTEAIMQTFNEASAVYNNTFNLDIHVATLRIFTVQSTDPYRGITNPDSFLNKLQDRYNTRGFKRYVFYTLFSSLVSPIARGIAKTGGFYDDEGLDLFNEDRAYSWVNYDDDATFTLVHEMGHLLGATHCDQHVNLKTLESRVLIQDRR